MWFISVLKTKIPYLWGVLQLSHLLFSEEKKKENNALAGSRTRIYCLEGNNANRYTTNALR